MTTPSIPAPNHRCPRCGQLNQCATARSGSFDTPCWCTTVRFDSALTSALSGAQRLACLCIDCATAPTDADSAQRSNTNR